MATIQNTLHLRRPNRPSHGAKAASLLTAASGHQDRMRIAQSSIDRLSHDLGLARGLRFVRPSSPLDPAWDTGLPTVATVQDLMIGSPEVTLVHTQHAMSITRASLLRVQPGRSDDQYLDTPIIDLYLTLFNEAVPSCGGGLRTTATPNGTRLQIMPTLLMLYLYELNDGPPQYQRVIDSKLLDKVNLDSLDMLAFPFSPIGSLHWWAIVFDFRTKTIQICDSLDWASTTHPTVQHLCTLISRVLFDDYKVTMSFSDWTVTTHGLPQPSLPPPSLPPPPPMLPSHSQPACPLKQDVGDDDDI